MNEKDFLKIFGRLFKVVVSAMVVLVVALVTAWFTYEYPGWYKSTKEPEPQTKATNETPPVDEGLFVEGDHRLLVIANCTGCHSGKLVTQNRATREGWRNMIRWMQETQNLKDLGQDEEKILDYLSKNYAPTTQGRRQNLVVDEWYELE